ncbi:hypothetical protein GGF50DRAFT_21513, partial [Schizophyllum commune]
DLDADTRLFTRETMPFYEPRVREILRLVEIGEDLSPAERGQVVAFVREFADCFALSLHEVRTVAGAQHTMDIPADATFSTRVHQRPLTEPQRRWYNRVLDEMLGAGVIEPVHPKDVKCVSPTTLAQKAH